ncbi:MAG: RluA family pseudouridine synthase, partial [Bdellovibrionales bacterium]|nr:RluA family pseudouridine synthase [Bdellovibrionales bacterium]
MRTKKIFKITVDDSCSFLRLDKFLSKNNEIASRSRAAQLIDAGCVSIDEEPHKVLKSSYKVSPGEIFVIELPVDTETSSLVPLEVALDIIYEDEDLLVVNKPAGMVVHPAAGHAHDTLVNALIHNVKNLSMGFGENRPGIVHRLDRDTSGLLVVAKNDFAQDSLAKQFQKKTVHRIYKALVHGHPKSPSGTIQSYLVRHPQDRKRFASEKLSASSIPQGKKAITHYKVLQNYSCGLSLIECQLETGRTHQIRVHMSESQHPIVADFIYGSKGRLKNLKSVHLRAAIQQLSRIALHAEQLG